MTFKIGITKVLISNSLSKKALSWQIANRNRTVDLRDGIYSFPGINGAPPMKTFRKKNIASIKIRPRNLVVDRPVVHHYTADA